MLRPYRNLFFSILTSAIYRKFYSIPEGIYNLITKVIWEQISSDLASKREVPLQQSLLLNAQNYISSKNYRLAIIEAVTALEIAISDFMKRSPSKSAVIQKWRYAPLQKKLEYVVKKLLPDNMKNEIEKQLSDSNVNLLNKCINAIKERNCAVHQGDDMQADKISKYIEAIQRMINYLDIA
jgi:hypothetical protein